MTFKALMYKCGHCMAAVTASCSKFKKKLSTGQRKKHVRSRVGLANADIFRKKDGLWVRTNILYTVICS